MVDWKKLLGTSVISTGLIFSAFAPALAADKAPVQASGTPTVALSSSGTPFDLGIANDEKLIDMLMKSGQIPKDASPVEADKALQSYLHKRAEAASKLVNENPP